MSAQDSNPILFTFVVLGVQLILGGIWFTNVDKDATAKPVYIVLKSSVMLWSLFVFVCGLSYCLTGPTGLHNSRTWIAFFQFLFSGVMMLTMNRAKADRLKSVNEDSKGKQVVRETDRVAGYGKTSALDSAMNINSPGVIVMFFSFMFATLGIALPVATQWIPLPMTDPIRNITKAEIIAIVALLAATLGFAGSYVSYFKNSKVFSAYEVQIHDHATEAFLMNMMPTKAQFFLVTLPLAVIFTLVMCQFVYALTFFNSDAQIWVYLFVCIVAPLGVTGWIGTYAAWFELSVFSHWILYSAYQSIPSVFLMREEGMLRVNGSSYIPSAAYADVQLLQDWDSTLVYTTPDKTAVYYLVSVTALLAVTIFWWITSYFGDVSGEISRPDDVKKKMKRDVAKVAPNGVLSAIEKKANRVVSVLTGQPTSGLDDREALLTKRSGKV
jgi:hypothetical protein